jgi:hypothetical protein
MTDMVTRKRGSISRLTLIAHSFRRRIAAVEVPIPLAQILRHEVAESGPGRERNAQASMILIGIEKGLPRDHGETPKFRHGEVNRTRGSVSSGFLNDVGWGGRIRTSAWRYQKPLPYRLATPQP